MNSNEMLEKQETNGTKKMKKSTIIGIIVIIVGIVLFIIGGFFLDADAVRAKFKGVDYKKDLDDTKISVVDIDIDYGKVVIEKSTDKKFHVDAQNVSENFKAEISESKFSVKSSSNGLSINPLYTFFQNYDSAEITIQLPEKEYNTFKFELSAGQCRLSDINTKNFDYDMSAGKICLENIKSENINIDMSAGQAELNNSECQTADIDMSAGKFTVDGLNCDRMSVDSSAGTFNVKNLECNGVLTTDMSAGSMEISNALTCGIDADMSAGKYKYSGTVNGNIKVDSSAGEVKFNLTNPESDFNTKYSMKIKCDAGRQSVSYNCEN